VEASEACRGLSTQEARHGAAAAAAAAATEWQAGGCEAGGGAVSRALALGGDAWWEVSASRRACGCAGHASSSLSPLAPEAECSGGRHPEGGGGGSPCEALARRPWMRQRRGQEVAVEVDTAASAEAVAGGESLVCTGRVASGCYTRGASTLRQTSVVWSEVAVWGVPQVSTVLCATAASLPCLCGVCRAVEVLGELLVLRVDAGRGRIPEALDARDTRRLGNLSRAAGVGIGAAARTSCRGRTGRCARVVTVKAVAIVTAWGLVGCGGGPQHGGEGGGDGWGGRQR